MTPVQERALAYIRDYIGRAGFSPSYTDVARHLGLVSKSNVHRIVQALCEAGHIRTRPHRARSIELVDRREDLRAVPLDALRAELARRGLTFDALASAPKPLAKGSATCAAECCQLVVEEGMLFCRPHWADLPRDLRDDIWKAFRRKDRERFEMLVTEARELVGLRYERVVERVA